MRKVFIEEYVKHREMENAEVQNLLSCIAKMQHPHQLLWAFCKYHQWKPYACGLLPCRMLALLWAQTSAHCFDVAKKTLLSENTYDILTRAGPKTLPKKVSKNSSGRLSWASFYMISVHWDLLYTFFGVATKCHSWASLYMISVHARAQKPS